MSTSKAGYLDLLNWVSAFGLLTRAGVEGTGTFRPGLCRFFIDSGITVFEVNRPDRSKRRLQGKSDPTDAESAARSVLSGLASALPKPQSGACEAMRIVSVARRSAVKANPQAINQVRALLVSAPQNVRQKLWRAKAQAQECVKACIKVRSFGHTVLLETLALTLKSLAKRWLSLPGEFNKLDKQLEKLTQKYARTLRSRLGVGPNTAATFLSVAGDNPERLKVRLHWLRCVV